MQFSLGSFFIIFTSICIGIASNALMYQIPPREWPSPIGFQPYLLFGVFIFPFVHLFALTVQAIVLVKNRLIALPLTHVIAILQGSFASILYFREHPGGYRAFGEFDPERHLLLSILILLVHWIGARYCGWNTSCNMLIYMITNTAIAYLTWYSLDLWSTI